MTRHVPALPAPLPPNPLPDAPRWRPRTALASPAPRSPHKSPGQETAHPVEAADEAAGRRRRETPRRSGATALRAPAPAGMLTDETLRILLTVQERGLGGLA